MIYKTYIIEINEKISALSAPLREFRFLFAFFVFFA